MKFSISYPCNLPFFISQKWNENPTYYNTIGMKGHNGWDFALPTGTKVYATHDGIVWFAGVDGTLSNTVMISSVTDGSKGYRTSYAHLSEIRVAPGQNVKRGELIGLSGNTGRYTTGPHLHFGVHEINNYSDVDPGNGYNGCIDPAQFFDGTYPTSKILDNGKFLAMQQAILDFQLSEGISVFKDKPLTQVLYGPATLQATKKFR